MSQAKNSTEVLQAMHWIIDQIGWCKGAKFRDKLGHRMITPFSERKSLDSVCLSGAYCLVEGNQDVKEGAWARLHKRLEPAAPVDWNDDAERTKQNVLQLLKDEINSKPL